MKVVRGVRDRDTRNTLIPTELVGIRINELWAIFEVENAKYDAKF